MLGAKNALYRTYSFSIASPAILNYSNVNFPVNGLIKGLCSAKKDLKFETLIAISIQIINLRKRENHGRIISLHLHLLYIWSNMISIS